MAEKSYCIEKILISYASNNAFFCRLLSSPDLRRILLDGADLIDFFDGKC